MTNILVVLVFLHRIFISNSVAKATICYQKCQRMNILGSATLIAKIFTSINVVINALPRAPENEAFLPSGTSLLQILPHLLMEVVHAYLVFYVREGISQPEEEDDERFSISQCLFFLELFYCGISVIFYSTLHRQKKLLFLTHTN